MVHDTPIGAVRARAYTIPADAPEADGTMAWTSTTMVTVEVEAGGRTGFGYTYGAGVAATLVAGKLAEVLSGRNAMDVPAAWRVMRAPCATWGDPGSRRRRSRPWTSPCGT